MEQPPLPDQAEEELDEAAEEEVGSSTDESGRKTYMATAAAATAKLKNNLVMQQLIQ